MVLPAPSRGRLTLYAAVPVFALSSISPACAQGEAVVLPEVVVRSTGPSGTIIPSRDAAPLPGIAPPSRTDLSAAATALPASTTVIDSAEIARLPVQNYVDLFRPVAGIDVSDFGQGGVGNGISLRGFDVGEHSRNIAFFVDGVPINEVSSIHIPDYVDLNPLIPETVRAISIVRGPFSVEAGDAALGGSVFIETKESEPFSTLNASGGSFESARGLATFSQAGPGILPYLAFEGFRTSGYRENGRLDRFNAFDKVTVPLDPGSSLSLRVQVYGTRFGEPGYLARDLVRDGSVSPRSAFDPADGGSKLQQTFVGNYRSGAPDSELTGVFYAGHDLFSRFSDFGGGQGGQVEERENGGARVRKVWTGSVANVLPTQVLAGADWRTDAIDVKTGPSVARRFTGQDLGLKVLQTNLAGYAQAQVAPWPWLKVTGGARFDQFFYDVTNVLDPSMAPKVRTNVLSPKGGVALLPTRWLELFANYGQGFRSPSAVGELIASPDLAPQTIESVEGGGRLVFDRFTLGGTVFFTNIANEIYQAAPDLPVQNLGRSRRDGFEIEARWIAYRAGASQLAIFANCSGVSARLLNGAGAIYVPNVPAALASLGTQFDLATSTVWPGAGHVTGTAYLTYTAAKPLDEAGGQRSSPFPRVSGQLAYVDPSGWTAFTQATWYPGDRLSEIALNFGDVVHATSADIFTAPVPRLTVRAGLTYGFATGQRRL